MIESLIIDLDPEHTFDHDAAVWAFIDTDSGVRIYGEDDELLFESYADKKETA